MPYNQLAEYAEEKDVIFEWDARGWSQRRPLPNSPKVECHLLRSMTLNDGARKSAKCLKSQDLFFTPANRIIFEGLLEMSSWNFSDAVWHFDKKGTLQEIGGKMELKRIWEIFPYEHREICAMNYPYYVYVLENLHMRREGILEAFRLQSALFDSNHDAEISAMEHLAKIRETFRIENKAVGVGIKVA